MTARPYRVLVTGSRNWGDPDLVWKALAEIARDLPADRDLLIVHGACPTGADTIADQWGRNFGATVERHPANWHVYGSKAGPIRNHTMVNLGADVCLAFIRNGSRGASHTAALAEQAGIPVRRWTS